MSCTPLHTFLFFWFSCQVSAVTIRQSPSQTVEASTEVHINCSHDDTNLVIMLWYQQKRDSQSMTLIGYGYEYTPNYEGQFEKQFKLTRENTVKGTLIIRSANLSDSAVYFCAASATGGTYAEAHFGSGTKLTVLEPNQTIAEPTVKVLKPCKSQKGNKTLVCVASKFYPDHVSVSWEIDAVVVNKTRVATDSAAVREGSYYSIKSMLRVSEEEWYTEGKKFRCAVRFYNGTDYVYRNKTIFGKWKVVMNTEQYLKTTQVAKISYSVIIAKSCVYGAFVAFFVWKLQGSAGKQDD